VQKKKENFFFPSSFAQKYRTVSTFKISSSLRFFFAHELFVFFLPSSSSFYTLRRFFSLFSKSISYVKIFSFCCFFSCKKFNQYPEIFFFSHFISE